MGEPRRLVSSVDTVSSTLIQLHLQEGWSLGGPRRY